MMIATLSILLFSYFLFDWYEGIVYKLIVAGICIVLSLFPSPISFLGSLIILLATLFFYTSQSWKQCLSFIILSSLLIFSPNILIYYLWMNLCFITFSKSNDINWIVSISYILLSLLFLYTESGYLVLLATTLVFLIILSIGENTSQKKWKLFEESLWTKHYDEMKIIYKDMRGFRHDFHNHAHVIKGYISQERYKEAQDYVNELVDAYESFDTQIHSGNLLVDTILNSKLQMATQDNIRCVVEAILPEELSIKETDVVIILGNALDNAIESCRELDDDARWIKVYLSIFKNQFYFSIMNGSTEHIDSKTKFISEKRGDHGHGISRMKQCVDKYDGYFNINQEEGVFGLEIMIPLPLMREL